MIITRVFLMYITTCVRCDNNINSPNKCSSIQPNDVYGGTFLYHLGEEEPLVVVGAVVSTNIGIILVMKCG